jgi:hypothetical protein
MKVQSRVGECRKVQDNQENEGYCRKVQNRAGKCRKVQDNAGK